MQGSRSRQVAANLGRLALGFLVIAAAILLLQVLLSHVQMSSAPPGWEIIRPPDEVSTLLIDNDTVWTGGKGGIIRIGRTNSTRLTLPAGAPQTGYVRQIFRNNAGTIWIGHDGGLVKYTGSSWEVIAPGPGIPFTRVLSLAQLPDGSMVAGTETDVYVAGGSGWQSLHERGMPAIGSADVLLVTRKGDLWIGCGDPVRGALIRLNGTIWHRYGVADGLPHPAVRALVQMDDGSVWAATGFSRNGGAARYYRGEWTNLTIADGLAGESTRSVFMDMAGRLWIGSEYDGIAVGGPGSWTVISAKDGLAGNEVKVLVQDSDGVYWLGTENGLSRIAPGALPAG